MSPRNPQLLYFLVLAVIPVILHFLLRAKPKKLLFPALRLIQNRRRANVRRLRLRHLLLMLLRIAVLVLLILAVARPSIPAADYSPTAGEITKVLVILCIAAGCYFSLMRNWRRRGLAKQQLAPRSTLLRYGLAAGTMVLLLLWVGLPFQRRIAAAITQPTITQAEDLPVAAAFLFDTGLSMEYRHEGQTRLEVAQEIATAHLSNLPSESRICVCDSSSTTPLRFSRDAAATQSRIDALAVRAIHHPLNDRLRAIIDLQLEDLQGDGQSDSGEGQDDFLREIYIFTDLASHAWQIESEQIINNELDRLPSLNVYLIDVGIEHPVNTGVTDLQLSSETLSLGNSVLVETTITATDSAAGKKTIEIYVQDQQGEPIKQGQSEIDVGATAAVRARFPLSGLTGPVAQGEVRIIAGDPLAFDDVRYFTLQVQPPPEILVVAEDRDTDALIWLQALAPDQWVRLGKAPYRCTYLTPDKLTAQELDRYAVVCLLNVAAPRTADWNDLEKYLKQGGGVAIVLGDRISAAAYLSQEAKRVLPADLLAKLRFDPPELLDMRKLAHPFLSYFADRGVGDLSLAEVQRYWKVAPLPGASVIIPFTDDRGAPAVVEKSVGKGRVMLLTTPLDAKRWNNLPTKGWFIVLADQIIKYLSRQSQEKLNYIAGQTPLVALDDDQQLKRYLLRKPGKQQLPGTVAVGETHIMVQDADEVGHFRLLAREPDISWETGFSVNAAAAESDLRRLETDDLDVLLGKGRYGLAKNIDGLTRSVRRGRLGYEIFPWIVMFMLVAFIGEHLMANHFYDTETIASDDSGRSSWEGRSTGKPTSKQEPAVTTG